MTNPDFDTRADGQTLEEWLAAGPIGFQDALLTATELAAELRELNAYGLRYGALSARTVVMGPRGTRLAPGKGLARKGDGAADVAAFGGLLELMLENAETPRHLLTQWAEAASLAERCVAQRPEIQQVLIALRLLGMRVRIAKPAPVEELRLVAGLSARLRSLASLAETLLGRQSGQRAVKSV